MDRVFGESCLSFFQKRLRTRSSLFAIAATGLVAAFSIHRLNGTPYEISFSAAIHELRPILASTLIPALKLSLIWAIGSD
jgi:hypothetical protein